LDSDKKIFFIWCYSFGNAECKIGHTHNEVTVYIMMTMEEVEYTFRQIE